MTKLYSALFHKNNRWWTIALLLFTIILILAYKSNAVAGKSVMDNFWQVIDPVAGIMTFVTTLVIFSMQAYAGWKESLENRLDINYFLIKKSGDKKILEIKGAYLSSETDIRAWGQALGRQVFGIMNFDLKFDQTPTPKIQKVGVQYYKIYEAAIYLTDDPTIDQKGIDAAAAFLQRDFTYSIADKESFIRWHRKK